MLSDVIGEIQNVHLADRFLQEGGVQPSFACREKTQETMERLHDELQWIPARIGPSLGGGVKLVYRFPEAQTIEIEIENDLLISCVISDKTAVLSSEVFDTSAEVYRFSKESRI